MLDVIIATSNRHKYRELLGLLRTPGIRWHDLAAVPRPPKVIENGRSFEANALKKARALAQATGWLALADDSGIEVEALGGAPGLRSARFAGRHGDDAANNRKMLRLLAGQPPARRRARYRCALALASPSGRGVVVQGVWAGHIAARPAGSRGFGYDPIFWLRQRGKTVAQLPDRVKRRLSHRADAARGLRPVLRRLARAASLTAKVKEVFE